MKKELTKKYVESLVPGAKRFRVLDARTRGLGVEIYPSGQKTYFHVRKVDHRPSRTTLGSHPEMLPEQARGKAEELNGKLAKWRTNDCEGSNPLRRARSELTFEGLLNDYCERGLPRSKKCRRPERAAADACWNFGKYLSDWRDRKLNQSA